jgi:hypothetical protein
MAVDLRSDQLSVLFAAAESRKLLLPNFQRDFVWSLEDQRSLAASLLLDIPLGSLLFLSGVTSEFSSRSIGSKERAKFEAEAECEYVLDGQQRLSSLYSIIADPYRGENWSDHIRGSYWNLRYRWAISVRPEIDGSDLFGSRHLSFHELPAEPDLVRPRLTAFRVKLSAPTASDWHHPGWRSELPEQQHLLELVNAAAKDEMIPLWRIAADGDSDGSLHVRVLQKIAATNKEKLEAKIDDGGEVIEEIRRALTQIRPDIDENSPVQTIREGLADLRAQWVQSMKQLLAGMSRFKIPVVDLPVKQVDRAIVIFESMNRGGTPLSTFDLLTARLARTDEQGNLSELVSERISACKIPITEEIWGVIPSPRPDTWSPQSDAVALAKDSPSTTFKNSFLAMLSLLANLAKGAELTPATMKQTEILNLQPEQVGAYWKPATDAILRAWAFLQIRCGIRSESDLRNKLLVIPIALALRADDALENKKLLDRLEYWYWCSVLTSTYTERQNDNAILDSKKLLNWIATGSAEENPFAERRAKVLKDPGYSDRDSLLRETEDAGVATDVGMYFLQYELSFAPFDILSESQRLFAWKDKTEDHHLVPLGSAKTIFESTQDIRSSNEGIGRLLNSPLNRSFVSAAANRTIGAMNLQGYLEAVPEVARIARGVPALSTIQVASYAASTDNAAATAKDIMRSRFNWMLDKTTSELDALLY